VRDFDHVGARSLAHRKADRVAAIEMTAVFALRTAHFHRSHILQPEVAAADCQVPDLFNGCKLAARPDAESLSVVGNPPGTDREVAAFEQRLQLPDIDAVCGHAVGIDQDSYLLRVDALQLHARYAFH